MQIAINTNSLTNMLVDDALALIHRAGVRHVELATSSQHNHAMELWERLSPRRVFHRFGLTCICVSGGWCDFVRGDTIGLGYQFHLVEMLDAQRIRLFVSNPRDEAPPTEENLNTAVAAIHDIAGMVPGTQICLENEAGLTKTAADTKWLLKAIDRQNVRTVFDPVNYMRQGQDPVAAVTVLNSWIKHVHVKDIKDGELCAVGDGEAPWAKILDELKAIGYKGYLSIEYEGKGDPVIGTIESLNALERLLNG